MDELSWLLRVFLLSCFAASAIGTLYVASLDSLPERRTGPRGFARAQARRHHPTFAALDPLIRWAGGRVQGLAPVPTLERLDRSLARAGDPLGLEPSELIATCGILGLLGACIGGLYAWAQARSGLYPVLFALLLTAFPLVRLDSLLSERSVLVGRQLPSAIDLLCLSLGAGLDFPGAIRQIVEKSGQKDAVFVQEFAFVLQALSLGRTRREALLGFLERNPSPSVREFVGATIQAEEEGQPLVEVLRVQASVSRERRTVFAEEASTRAGLQMLMPTALLFLAVFGLIGGPLAIRLAEAFQNV